MKKKNQKNKKIQIFFIAIIAVILVLVIVLSGKRTPSEDTKQDKDNIPTKMPDKIQESIDEEDTDEENIDKESTDKDDTDIKDTQIEDEEPVSTNLGYGIQLEKIGSYTGMYMEDGSDAFVSGVSMVMVSNVGEEYIQYAEVTVALGEKEAHFNFSTLYPGETIVMLEQNQLPYSEISGAVNAIMENVVLFDEKPEAHEDTLKIQALDGAFNVTNISGKDITEDIMIYYKNSMNDVLYGGITYRGTITGGIKAGEIKQVISEHFTKDGSRVMFVTWG